MISPTEFEEVITEEDCEVPQDYIETITVEVPTLVSIPTQIEEPEEYYEEVELDVPYVIEV
jgi:hypothetical protein